LFVVIVCGLFLAAGMIFGVEGTDLLPMSTFAIILNLKPVFIILISFVFADQILTFRKFVVILVSFIGATLIVYPSIITDLLNYFTGSSKPHNQEKEFIDDHCT
jgi:drug/metabolite transporter (DMT)-like permease